ncbi:MAG: YpdA family putative bacillithiol disulfide reductase [Gemmatimonadota bacterium]|nr:MAG: YpdA family putative bacillithiol disulfide reductase [Gemmatimonadota bacterium]
MKHEDTLIVGAGPIGLACAISAKRHGFDPLIIDAGAIVNSILHYPTGTGFFTTPELLEVGGHPFTCAGEKPTREEALKYYRGVVRAERLRVLPYTRLTAARRSNSGISCRMEHDVARLHRSVIWPPPCPTNQATEQEIQTQRLVLATGYYDNPNSLGVPGEDLPHVRQYFDEAHANVGLDVVVIGGRNSAVEAALLLYRAGARTALVSREHDFSGSVKYWLRPDIENRIRAGEIVAHLGATVTTIGQREVSVRLSSGATQQLPADHVYALIGFHADFELFRRIGIELDPESGVPRLNPETLETNVRGVFMAGSITAGRETATVFIENGRLDGEKIFGMV